LILAGANRLKLPDTFLTKVLAFIWRLAPSQTAPWSAISLIVLVILIILGFVAGCKLIAYFMREEMDQWRSEMKKEYGNALVVGIVGGILTSFLVYVFYGTFPWAFLFIYPIVYAAVQVDHTKRRARERAKRKRT